MAKKDFNYIVVDEDAETLRVYLERDDNGDVNLKINDYYVAALTPQGTLKLFSDIYDRYAQVDESGFIVTEKGQ